jgi:hypothetical protein
MASLPECRRTVAAVDVVETARREQFIGRSRFLIAQCGAPAVRDGAAPGSSHDAEHQAGAAPGMPRGARSSVDDQPADQHGESIFAGTTY